MRNVSFVLSWRDYQSAPLCIYGSLYTGPRNASQVLTSNRDGRKACTKFIHYRLTREHGELFALISDMDLLSRAQEVRTRVQRCCSFFFGRLSSLSHSPFLCPRVNAISRVLPRIVSLAFAMENRLGRWTSDSQESWLKRSISE